MGEDYSDGVLREGVLGPIEMRQLKAGTVVRLEQSGGAGYGNPFERPGEQVLEDLQNGYITPEAAAAEYGVVIDPRTCSIDPDATRALRSQTRRSEKPEVKA